MAEQKGKPGEKGAEEKQEIDRELVKLMSMQRFVGSYAIVKKLKNAKGKENIYIGFFDQADWGIVNIGMDKEAAFDLGVTLTELAKQ